MTFVLPQSLQCCIQHRLVSDRVITTPNGIWDGLGTIQWSMETYYAIGTSDVFLIAWWRHQLKTFSAFLAICAGNSPVNGEFPAQRPVTRSADVFFDLCLNKQLNEQWWGWWFETPLCPLWRHSDWGKYTHWCLVSIYLRRFWWMCQQPLSKFGHLHRLCGRIQLYMRGWVRRQTLSDG